VISERQFIRSFDSFWGELLPLLTPTYIAVFNESCVSRLKDLDGDSYGALELPKGIRHPDIVAELAFRLAGIVYGSGTDINNVTADSELLPQAERLAVDLVGKYEGARPEIALPLGNEERREAARLAKRYAALYRAFPVDSKLEYCPIFPGAGILDTSEGDLAIGDTLIEVKTTSRRPSSKDLRQVIVYMALDSQAGLNRWSKVALFNPRRGELYSIDVEALVTSVSGGRSRSAVFGDLVEFLEADHFAGEARF
jgi:hypothetical protein